MGFLYLCHCGAIDYVFGALYNTKKDFTGYAMAVLAVLTIKIVGYSIAEGIIYGNWIAPVASIYGNAVQIMTAVIIAFPAMKAIKLRN